MPLICDNKFSNFPSYYPLSSYIKDINTLSSCLNINENEYGVKGRSHSGLFEISCMYYLKPKLSEAGKQVSFILLQPTNVLFCGNGSPSGHHYSPPPNHEIRNSTYLNKYLLLNGFIHHNWCHHNSKYLSS